MKRKFFQIIFALALALGITLATAAPAMAAVTVTPASGGTAIPASTAGGAYTSLTSSIKITEAANGDIPASQTNKTLILTAPTGFQFNSAVTPSITVTAGRDITAISVAITSAQITVTLTTDGFANKIDTITIGAATAIQVRPTAGTPLASGQIYRSSTTPGTATINGITTTANTNGSGGSNFGTLTEVAGALDHFAISNISSPQTAGTTITGITLTAQDSSNNTVTSFTTTVTYSGSAGITGTSAAFTAGQLTGVSVTPTASGTGKTFTVTGGSSKTGTATFNVNPGALDHFAISTISSLQTAGTAITGITLTAQDVYSNTVTSYVSTVAYSGTAGITGTSASFTSGVLSSVSVTPTIAGTGKTFIVTGGSSKTGTATFNVNPGVLDHFAISPISSPQTAGTAITGITLTAQDVYNNTQTSFTTTVTYSGTANITGTSVAFTAGQLTGVSVTPTISGTGKTFTVTGSTKTGTTTFNVNPGAANATQSTLTPTSASIAANGSSTQVLTVTAKDAYGNNLTAGGATVTITKSSGTGTIGSVTDNGNGNYTATVTSPISTGSGIFVATLGGQTVKSGTGTQTQSTIAYTVGGLDHYAISAISSPQTAGTAITGITITAQDSNNNTVTSFTGTVVYSGTAGITGTSANFTSGQLTGISVTPTSVGPGRTFIVTNSTFTGTATFNINPGALDHFAISTISSPQTSGTAITGITLTAQDLYNNTVTSFNSTVTYSGSANITGTSANFTSGQLTGVSVTPASTGSGKTFIVTGATKTGTATFDVNPAEVPTVVSATSSTDGSIITITFSKNMSNPAGNEGQFFYQVNGGPNQPFSAIYLDAIITKLILTTNGAPFIHTDNLTLSYTPGTVQATDTGLLASFTGQSVFNTIPAAAPTFVSATTNGAGNVITITFSKAMANPSGLQGQFKYQVNAGPVQPFSAAALNINTAKIDLTTSGTGITNGDTVTVSYTAGSVTAADSGVLATFTSQSVTNNMFAPVTISASADSGGTISPSGAVAVTYGNNQPFIITANPGYIISNVVVDGVSLGAVTNHTVFNVTTGHSIYATFYTTSVAGSTGNINVPAGQTNYIIDASAVAQTIVTVNTGAIASDINVINYSGNPHPEATLPANMIPRFNDIIVGNGNGVTWSLHVEMSYTMPEVSGLVESSLRMYYFKNGVWNLCSSTGVNTTAKFVWADMTEAEALGSPIIIGGPSLAGPTAVGGTVFRINKIQVLAPYFTATAMGMLLLAGGVGYLVKKRRAVK